MITPEWEWDWVYTLHDAKILSVLQKDIPWDPAKKIPDNNCLIMKIDCNGLPRETREKNIIEIRFYNFKVLTIDFDLNALNGGWWLSDDITQKGERYFMELRFDTAKHKTKRLELRFARVEVIRDNHIN